MGKRSSFDRNPRDFYPTPKAAADVLAGHVDVGEFTEPCCGDGALARHLEAKQSGARCVFASDVEPQGYGVARDALSLTSDDIPDCHIITNPPWDRKILHPLIDHLSALRPTWLLFDADWMHTKQAAPHMRWCREIVSVGKVKWIPDSPHTGKDNACWYLFHRLCQPNFPRFVPRWP